MHGESLSKELKNKMKPGEQRTYMSDPYPSHLPQFYHQNNILWGIKITKLLIIQVSSVSYYFLWLTPKYLPHYPILEHPQMTHTTTFQMLHFTFSRIHVKSTTALLHCTPPTKTWVLTHCKLCLKPLNCTITLSVKRINIYSKTANRCYHTCHFLQVLLISLSPKKSPT